MENESPSLWPTPGTILYLPSANEIPVESIIYRQRWERWGNSFPLFEHPVLVLKVTPMLSVVTVDFIPIVALKGAALKTARNLAHRLVWHQRLLIDESWRQEDFRSSLNDLDVRLIERVYLDEDSAQMDIKHWLVMEQKWRIEAKFLQRYTLPTHDEKGPSQPNPKYFLGEESLQRVQYLMSYIESHPLPIMPSSLLDFGPLEELPKVGHVYRLPFETDNDSLNQAQTLSNPEQPLGKPILIARVDGPLGVEGGVPAVVGFMLTDLEKGTADREFRPDKRFTRAQYLPIEGLDAVRHDSLPAVRLGKNSPRFNKLYYVHALNLYRVAISDLNGWTNECCPEIFFDLRTVQALLRWHSVLRKGPRDPAYFEGRRILEQQGLAGLLVHAQDQIAHAAQGGYPRV